jgi:hypothetical protein
MTQLNISSQWFGSAEPAVANAMALSVGRPITRLPMPHTCTLSSRNYRLPITNPGLPITLPHSWRDSAN